jgi:hypothetical protein
MSVGAGHQFVVCALLDNAAMSQDDDPIGMPDIREPVRDQDRGSGATISIRAEGML